MKTLLLTVPFLLVLLAFLNGVDSGNPQMSVPGGLSEEKAVTPEVKQLIRGIHPQIKSHLGGVPGGNNIIGKIKAISYRTQLVNGIIYFVKVKARTAQKTMFYHLRIYKSFDKEPAQLMKVQGPKRKRDEITSF